MKRVTRGDIVLHFAAPAVSLLHVLLLDLVVICCLYQPLQLVDGFRRCSGSVHVFHLEAQVSLRYEPVGAFIDLLDEDWIDDHAQLLRILILLVEHSDTLADRLIIIHVLYTLNKVPNVQLLVKFEVEHGRFIQKLDIAISLVLRDLLVHFVKRGEFICCHGVAQGCLRCINVAQAVVATADGALRVATVLVFEDPSLGRTELAIELVAVFAVVLDISEIKFRAIALLA